MFHLKSLKQIGMISIIIIVAFLFSFLISKWIHSPLTKSGVKIYYADNISEVHSLLINKFNSQNTGKIEVVPVDLPFSKFSTNQRKELLTRALRSQSDKLDIFAVDVIWGPRFSKWSIPLDPYFPDVDALNINPSVLKTAIYDSSLVALPLYSDLMHIYYRTDILEKIPGHKNFMEQLRDGITWEELIAFSAKLQANKDNFFIFPGDSFEGLMCMFFANLYSQDYQVSADSILLKQDTRTIKAIKIFHDLVKVYSISPQEVLRMDEYQGYLYALENDGIIFVGWPGLLEQHKNELQEKGIYDKIGVGPLPHFKNGKIISILGGWNLMISRSSKNIEASIAFLRFLIKPENQRVLIEKGGYLPAYGNVFKDKELSFSTGNRTFYSWLSTFGINRPGHVHYTQFSEVFSRYINLAISGEISPQAALEKARKELQTLKIIPE